MIFLEWETISVLFDSVHTVCKSNEIFSDEVEITAV